ncbi:uncharacterized protein K441DRAFT_538409 [Cenococcum geophilum 1.58]|uniref:uncharacterized protein n=1 Tax=Cenococcum geophilum 1.58 TaxID=794803 RepID=UPI00358F35C0|nr:hypothetical protein K441DRAFT_538409 [Cenococcum geophilum 1.58]
MPGKENSLSCGRSSPVKALPALPNRAFSFDKGNETEESYTAATPTISRRPVASPSRQRYSKEELPSRLAEAEEKLEQKDEEIRQLKSKNDHILKEWRETCANLAQTKATISYKIDDQHFIDTWYDLRYQIRSWAMQHFSGRLKITTRLLNSQMPNQGLTRLTSLWKSYLKSDNHRAMLVQAFIWDVLRLDVFAPPGQSFEKGSSVCWAVDDQRPLAHLNHKLRPAIENMRKIPQYPDHALYVRDYFSWRIATMVLIERKYGNNKERLFNHSIPSLVGKIRDVLSPYTSSGQQPEQIFGPDLSKILRTAIHLDVDMWKQKALFYPSLPAHTLSPADVPQSPYLPQPEPVIEYDPESMDLYEGTDQQCTGRKVTLVIAPQLVKAGNSDGEGYEYFMTRVKSQVSCQQVFRQKTISATPQQSQRASQDTERQPGKFKPTLQSQNSLQSRRHSIDRSNNIRGSFQRRTPPY